MYVRIQTIAYMYRTYVRYVRYMSAVEINTCSEQSITYNGKLYHLQKGFQMKLTDITLTT